MQKTKATLLALLIALPGTGTAQDGTAGSIPIRPDDLTRLLSLNGSAGQALLEAFASGSKDDLDILINGLSGTPTSSEEAAKLIVGEWNCQMIKLGKGVPIVVYQNFACIAKEDGGFEKTSGSQRTKGNFYQDQYDRMIYLGTGYIAGDTPPPYAELPEKVGAQDDPQRMPEVGLVEMITENKGRILFPDPHLESRMNVLLLTR